MKDLGNEIKIREIKGWLLEKLTELQKKINK